MFGSIGGFEMLVLMAIGLLVFGPRKLPEVGRTLGKAMVEFRRAAMELRSSIEKEISLEDLKDTRQSVSREMDEGLEAMKRLPGLSVLPGLDDEPAKPGTGSRAGDGVDGD
jgi:Tat protein translocase TatB subunit